MKTEFEEISHWVCAYRYRGPHANFLSDLIGIHDGEYIKQIEDKVWRRIEFESTNIIIPVFGVIDDDEMFDND